MLKVAVVSVDFDAKGKISAVRCANGAQVEWQDMLSFDVEEDMVDVAGAIADLMRGTTMADYMVELQWPEEMNSRRGQVAFGLIRGQSVAPPRK